jgi:hypothetical protein
VTIRSAPWRPDSGNATPGPPSIRILEPDRQKSEIQLTCGFKNGFLTAFDTNCDPSDGGLSRV